MIVSQTTLNRMQKQKKMQSCQIIKITLQLVNFRIQNLPNQQLLCANQPNYKHQNTFLQLFSQKRRWSCWVYSDPRSLVSEFSIHSLVLFIPCQFQFYFAVARRQKGTLRSSRQSATCLGTLCLSTTSTQVPAL